MAPVIIDLLSDGLSAPPSPSEDQLPHHTDPNAEGSDTDCWDSHGDADTFKCALDDFLSGVQTFGSFATSGRVPGDVSTGLTIPTIGHIAFPLLEIQAKDIINLCHRAPFGKGSETKIDESVRKTWELNPDEFVLSNPFWPAIVDEVTEKVKRELGCAPLTTVKANLYKLLLYEEGAFFKPHKDTEKESGMFGTLVIHLPSVYTGGALVASHCGQSRKLEAESRLIFTPTSPGKSYQVVATKPDVETLVLPITSGYRIVLVYNLVNVTSEPAPSASLNLRSQRKLGRILQSWSRAAEKDRSVAPKALVYLLDHKYTSAHLCLLALKGLDKVKAEYLQKLCAKAGICFYLASMESSKEGGAEEDYMDGGSLCKFHELEEVYEKHISLKQMVDLDGHLLAQEVDLDEGTIVQEDPFERDPDAEDYEGYTGNAGASATHWYRDTVMVLVPLSQRGHFLKSPLQHRQVNADAWIRNSILFVQDHPTSRFAKDDLCQLSYSILRTPKLEPRKNTLGYSAYQRRKDLFPAPGASLPFKVSVVLKDRPLFEEAVKALDMSPSDIFFDLGSAIYALNVTLSHPPINRLVDNLHTFHGRIHAVNAIENGYVQAGQSEALQEVTRQEEFSVWVLDKCRGALGLLDSVVKEDGYCLADLALRHPEIVHVSRCVTIGKNNTSNSAFLVALTTRIHAKNNFINEKDTADAETLLMETAKILASEFVVECRKSSKRASPGIDNHDVECLADGHDVALLLSQLRSTDLINQSRLIVEKLFQAASTCELIAFNNFYFPLLSKLTDQIITKPNILPDYQVLFQNVLSTYIKRYVQAKPKANDLTRPPAGCGSLRCPDCRTLDIFLSDPKQTSKGFPVSKSRRQHLHQQLEGTRHSHNTDRSTDTLIVKKGLGTSDMKLLEWKKRAKAAREKISGLNHKVLEDLLGPEYTNIAELRAVRNRVVDLT